MNWPRPPALAVLVAIGALLAAWLVPIVPPPTSRAAMAPAPASLALSAPPALTNLNETTARPLFSPTRRPVPGAAVSDGPPASAAALLTRYRLQGVVIDGKRRRVLLSPAQGGKVLSVAEGESVEGWTIERIAPESLTLRSGVRIETVELGTVRNR